MVHGVQLRAELSNRVVELSRRAEELRQSRERLVDAYDDERRRLERDIHDGAQQHLVALTVNLRLAETIAKSSSRERARERVADQVAATDDAIATLVDLSRGIYPGILTEAGIGPALRSAAFTSPVPVDVRDRTGGIRLSSRDRGGGLLLLSRGGPERCQARCRRRCRDRDSSTGRSGDLRASRTTDAASIQQRCRLGSGLANMRDRIDSVGGRVEARARVDRWYPGRRMGSCASRRRDGGRVMSYRCWVWPLVAITVGSLVADTVLLMVGTGTLMSDDTDPEARVAVDQPRLTRQLAPRRDDRASLPHATRSGGCSASSASPARSRWSPRRGPSATSRRTLADDVSRAWTASSPISAGWLGGPLALVLLTIVFLIVPDGHWLSRRWKYVGVASASRHTSSSPVGICLRRPADHRRSADDAPKFHAGPGAGLLSGVVFVGSDPAALLGILAMVPAAPLHRRGPPADQVGAVRGRGGRARTAVHPGRGVGLQPRRTEWWTNLPLFWPTSTCSLRSRSRSCATASTTST